MREETEKKQTVSKDSQTPESNHHQNILFLIHFQRGSTRMDNPLAVSYLNILPNQSQVFIFINLCSGCNLLVCVPVPLTEFLLLLFLLLSFFSLPVSILLLKLSVSSLKIAIVVVIVIRLSCQHISWLLACHSIFWRCCCPFLSVFIIVFSCLCGNKMACC